MSSKDARILALSLFTAILLLLIGQMQARGAAAPPGPECCAAAALRGAAQGASARALAKQTETEPWPDPRSR